MAERPTKAAVLRGEKLMRQSLSQCKCPPGYTWRAEYRRKKRFGGTVRVKGHCVKIRRP